VLFIASACGGSETERTDNTETVSVGNQTPTSGQMVPTDLLPDGNIVLFGAVSIADEQGEASDLIGGFFNLSQGVDSDYFDLLAAPDSTNCYVDSDDNIDFEEISASYIPSLKGVQKTSTGAGEFVYVEAAGSSYVELAQQPVGALVFYDLAPGQSIPTGPIPLDLKVNIPGDGFPSFPSVPVPKVAALKNFTISTGVNIQSTSVFTWSAEPDSSSQVRIFTSTAGGFFLENGMTVSCIVPDTGRFVFPDSVKRLIGSGFNGAPPIVSRLQTHIAKNNDAVLFVIRESFF
jgi:hypothetical protein